MTENHKAIKDYLRGITTCCIAVILSLSSVPSLKAQEDYLNKRIKEKVPEGIYSVQSHIPPGGEGRSFLYLVDRIDDNRGIFYLSKNSITELDNKSLEEIIKYVKDSSRYMKEVDYNKINVVPVNLKGQIVGYLIHTDDFTINSWQKKGSYFVNPNMKPLETGGGEGGGGEGGGGGGGGGGPD